MASRETQTARKIERSEREIEDLIERLEQQNSRFTHELDRLESAVRRLCGDSGPQDGYAGEEACAPCADSHLGRVRNAARNYNDRVGYLDGLIDRLEQSI